MFGVRSSARCYWQGDVSLYLENKTYSACLFLEIYSYIDLSSQPLFLFIDLHYFCDCSKYFPAGEEHIIQYAFQMLIHKCRNSICDAKWMSQKHS